VNAAEYAKQKRRAQGPGVLVGGAEPTKMMVVGSFQTLKSQRLTSGNPSVPPERSQLSELCRKCNQVHWRPCKMATGTCYRCTQFSHFSKDCVGKGVA
jgi:hypothetical protein